jgi:NAD(P) transhydrogenase subunit alpha
MRLGVPKEIAAGENRVALVPDSVARLTKAGFEVMVEANAGASAYFDDQAYVKAGAIITPESTRIFGEGDLVLKVQRPSAEEIAMLRPGATLAAFVAPAVSGEMLGLLASRSISTLAMELVPRISAAQSMDALSSQATVSGYKAVVLGAGTIGRMMPMMITAAGTLVPAKVFVIGAGVAGLQAIATSRRLGAVVSAFDVRAAARQEVESLGAAFVATADVPQNAEATGGYARELKDEETRRVMAAIGGHIVDQDMVITTAQIPGRPAPRLITADMVATMKPGSVIVDLAAETGGNCELTRHGETVESGGVRICGVGNLAPTVPTHASQMYSRNLEALIKHITRDGKLNLDVNDRITGPMLVTHGGEVRYQH